MKKKTKLILLGIVMVFAMALSGCGVNQKTPEKVVESLIKEYVNGNEKKVKKCYTQDKDANELLQSEIDATIKYFAAHNPTKLKVEKCDTLSETKTIRMYIFFITWYWKMSRNIPVWELIW